MEGEMNRSLSIDLPVSKSICNRLLIMEALAGVPLSHWENECEDIEDMRKCIIEGLEGGKCHVKESGTALRFLIAFFALARPAGSVTEISCRGRLAQRPIEGLLKMLMSLGMSAPKIVTDEDKKSVFITSSVLNGGSVIADTALTSQFSSALLLIAPYLSSPLCIKGDFKSMPYVGMTIELMRRCGIHMDEEGEWIKVYEGGYKNLSSKKVEADWSAASFFYEYAAINGGKIYLKGLKEKGSLQGDAVWVPRLFYDLGISTDATTDGIEIERGSHDLIYSRYNLSSCPDVVIPYVISCCFCGVKFRLRGLASLRHKESDRIEALKVAMRQMGYVLEEGEEEGAPVLMWKGERCEALPEGAAIEDFSDHRIAMAIECVGRGWPALHPDCVKKSFPNFYEELKKLKDKR